MSEKTYAMFNTVTITGRVSFAEEVTNNGDSWVSVTLLSELQNDAAPIAITFNSSNGLLSNFRQGWLNSGRRVTVTGHIASFAETYFDKKSGKRSMLKRPKLHLTGVQVLPGGYGPGPKKEDAYVSDEIDEVAVDPTPSYGEATDLAAL